MIIDYIKLKLYRRFQKRFRLRKTKILNYTVFYNDPRSLFSEYKLIFKDKIYHFGSENNSPLIVDGGGHIGLAVLYFKHIYPKSKIMIFEPDPEALPLLKRNIETNDLKNISDITGRESLEFASLATGKSKLSPVDSLANITIYPLGLGDQEAEVYLENSGTDAAKIGNSNLGTKIKTVKLSDYINSEIDFLKLNIEGAELNVIKDLELNNKLNNIKEMVIEWHSFAEQSQNLGELLTILEKNNFKYLINHYDYLINKVLKPPFSLKDKTQYYLLIYAKKI